MVLIGAQCNFGEFMGKFLRASMNLIRNYLNGSRVQVLTIMTVTNDATGLNLAGPSEPGDGGVSCPPHSPDFGRSINTKEKIHEEIP